MKTHYHPPEQQQNWYDALPRDIQDKIDAYLSSSELQHLSLLSKDMRTACYEKIFQRTDPESVAMQAKLIRFWSKEENFAFAPALSLTLLRNCLGDIGDMAPDNIVYAINYIQKLIKQTSYFSEQQFAAVEWNKEANAELIKTALPYFSKPQISFLYDLSQTDNLELRFLEIILASHLNQQQLNDVLSKKIQVKKTQNALKYLTNHQIKNLNTIFILPNILKFRDLISASQATINQFFKDSYVNKSSMLDCLLILGESSKELNLEDIQQIIEPFKCILKQEATESILEYKFYIYKIIQNTSSLLTSSQLISIAQLILEEFKTKNPVDYYYKKDEDEDEDIEVNETCNTLYRQLALTIKSLWKRIPTLLQNEFAHAIAHFFSAKTNQQFFEMETRNHTLSIHSTLAILFPLFSLEDKEEFIHFIFTSPLVFSILNDSTYDNSVKHTNIAKHVFPIIIELIPRARRNELHTLFDNLLSIKISIEVQEEMHFYYKLSTILFLIIDHLHVQEDKDQHFDRIIEHGLWPEFHDPRIDQLIGKERALRLLDKAITNFNSFIQANTQEDKAINLLVNPSLKTVIFLKNFLEEFHCNILKNCIIKLFHTSSYSWYSNAVFFQSVVQILEYCAIKTNSKVNEILFACLNAADLSNKDEDASRPLNFNFCLILDIFAFYLSPVDFISFFDLLKKNLNFYQILLSIEWIKNKVFSKFSPQEQVDFLLLTNSMISDFYKQKPVPYHSFEELKLTFSLDYKNDLLGSNFNFSMQDPFRALGWLIANSFCNAEELQLFIKKFKIERPMKKIILDKMIDDIAKIDNYLSKSQLAQNGIFAAESSGNPSSFTQQVVPKNG